MPRPKRGEKQSNYVGRFMGSDEAQRDFPDKKQRLAVAYSMWRRRGKKGRKRGMGEYG